MKNMDSIKKYFIILFNLNKSSLIKKSIKEFYIIGTIILNL